ncbi:hypothetical protein Tco_0706203 [Tanacetum coccineum]|uniref:Transposase (Putative), gypsy type n=1 Tax=Tanacetum coccineum TaxID=301880 RepID=A0ABQ4Y8W7_9ASTR
MIDATVFPLSVPWFNGTSIVKDPLPVEDAVHFLCVELLNLNRTVIRKYPETFLCLVGLSRSFTENDVRPTLLCDDDGEMGSLNFVQSADPFKVKTGERTLATNKFSLVDHTNHDELKTTRSKKKKKVAFVAGPPPAKRARTEDVATSDARPATADNSLVALRRLIKQGASEDGGFGFVVPATEDLASSVTPTSERKYEDDSDHGNNVRTRLLSGRFTVYIPVPQILAFLLLLRLFRLQLLLGLRMSSNDDFYDSQSVDSTTAGDVYVPRWSVTNEARIDNPTTCTNFLDHVTPHGYWVALRNQSNAGFLNSFNINYAQHTSMVSELRLRFEHEIMLREKFEKKFSKSAAIVQQRDTEIADLKAKLGKAESEAAEVVTLSQHVTELEMASAARAIEVVALNERNARGKVAGEMKMREEFKSVQDAAARRLDERVAEMNGRIADVKRDMDDHLYPHMFTAIAGRRWVISMAINKGIQEGLRAGIKHGKEGRSLAQIEAYDPEIEAKFVVVVSEFKNISFPLLDELEGLRDSPLAPIMSALTLKDDHGNVDTSPLGCPAERRGLCPPSNPAPSTSIGISDYQISTLAQPHDDLFDAGVLDKPVDA